MLTRRHIRVKVMQSLYAYSKSKNEKIDVEEKFLRKSMQDMHNLFLLMLSLLVEVKRYSEKYLEKSQHKHLATEADINPNLKFVNNAVIEQLEQNKTLKNFLEDKSRNHWENDDEYVDILWADLKESLIYLEYMETRTSGFKEDKAMILDFFKEIVAPNAKLYDYFEDKKLTWLDDLPLVNTAIVKMLQKADPKKEQIMPSLFKNEDDRDFAVQLFRKTLLNDIALTSEMRGKTPNWDQDRIAGLDTVLIKMAICEFLKFPSIPVKVTINEYLEIAKEYSTPKSSIFINGVLDKLSKEYKETNKLNKSGRGLM